MRIIRNNTDKCLLCNCNNADKTTSHIVPASLLEKVIGEKNKEHSYLFSNQPDELLEEYFGRDNKQKLFTEIKKPNFAYDFILCKKCETYFSKIESMVTPTLKNINKTFETEKKEFNKIRYVEIQKLNPNLIRLLFYSIIWRLIIQDFVENGTFPTHIIDLESKLKNILLKYNLLQNKDLKKVEFSDNFVLKILTTKQKYYQIGNFFNYQTENPYFFIAGQFFIYLFDTEKQAEEKYKNFFNKNNPILNYAENNFKVVYVDNVLYENIIKKLWEIYLQKLGEETKVDFFQLINEKNDIINKISKQNKG